MNQFKQQPGASRPETDGKTLLGIEKNLSRWGRYDTPYEVSGEDLAKLQADLEARAFDQRAALIAEGMAPFDAEQRSSMIGVTMKDGRTGWMVRGVAVVAKA